MDAIERLAQALGCQYLSDLHYITLGRAQAEKTLARLEPPLTAADYQALIQYLTYGAGCGALVEDQLPGLCAELLSHERKKK